MNLKQMYELKMTPERKVEAFRRFVIKLKQQKYFGRVLEAKDYMRPDLTLFREEALYLKDLDAAYDTNVRLTKEIRCLEEMTDQQILCYYTLVKGFRNNVLERSSMAYARYYMLEVVNLIYQETPKEAFEALFSFWDTLNRKKKVSPECEEYFYQICQLFLLAHQELIPQMIQKLEAGSDRDFSGTAFEQIAAGDYRDAAAFVTQNARLLKKEELWSETLCARCSREALPFVFAQLEQKFSEYDFRRRLLDGFYVSAYIGDYYVKGADAGKKEKVSLSAYRYYEYQEYSAYWKLWYFVLRECVQDMLHVIFQYTQACVRRLLKLGYGKCSAARFLKKSYERSTDRLEDVKRLKAMVADERFEEAVLEGVFQYLKEHQIPLPEKKKRGPKIPGKEAIDYAKDRPPAFVDQEKLRQARKDAKEVLGMLSEGELDYERAPEQAEAAKKPAADDKNTDILPSWKEGEKKYLRCIMDEDDKGAGDILAALGIPENIMMKQINEKALNLLDDLLLERADGAVRVVEDYLEEAEDILREEA